MTEYKGSDFLQLAESHSKAVAYVNALRLNTVQQEPHDVRDSLAKAIAREEKLRELIIEWKPVSNDEAQFKLLYIAQYLFAMKGSLNDDEMAQISNSIAHLR